MNKTKLTTNKISIDEQTTNKISIDEQTTTHYRGNFYYSISMNSIYILCRVDYNNGVCLVGISTANRYSNPVSVSDISTITDSEFYDVCMGEVEDFKLLSSVDITASI